MPKKNPPREAILKVTLDEMGPPVWRRVAVPLAFTLKELHAVIQIVMGWENSHLHQFEQGKRKFSDPDFEIEPFDDEIIEDTARITIGEILKEKLDTLKYLYDFGDSWEHTVTLEKTRVMVPAHEFSPRCLAGARACPPEDCGGSHGYMLYLEAMLDPRHPEHEEYLRWRGPFDPERFDRKLADWILHCRYHLE